MIKILFPNKNLMHDFNDRVLSAHHRTTNNITCIAEYDQLSESEKGLISQFQGRVL